MRNVTPRKRKARIPVDFDLPQMKCGYCGHTWYPRTPMKPVRCASCKYPNWERGPVRKLRGKKP